MFYILIVLHFLGGIGVFYGSMLYPAPHRKRRSPLVRLIIEGLCRIGKGFPLPKNDVRIPTLTQTTGKGCFPHIVVAQGEMELSPIPQYF